MGYRIAAVTHGSVSFNGRRGGIRTRYPLHRMQLIRSNLYPEITIITLQNQQVM